MDGLQVQDDQSFRALREYSERLGHQPPLCFDRDSLPWHVAEKDDGKVQVSVNLEKDLVLQAGGLQEKIQDKSTSSSRTFQGRQLRVSGWAEDSDGEEVRVCHLCKLPLGEIGYSHSNFPAGARFHGECKAELIAQDGRDEMEARQAKERQLKSRQRSEYCIGWDPIHIARSCAASGKLSCSDIPQGMLCLVLEEDGCSVRLASTSEPAAAVNLEYLSIALQVRRREGREPMFSLDPVTPDDSNSMQKKVFVPEWLAGTSAGEVLFQADYHLKELSMGDAEQPIVGMKSCLDFADNNSQYGWAAREWFFVRKAEMQISDSDMLIPLVKMGVEAREQTVQGNIFRDIAVTRPDHPMVQYAEAFTGNFDLIAERRSVIYYLRELAKASILAKFLLDPRIKLDESWFSLGKEATLFCSMEVPQLWNARISAQVNLKDGKDISDSKVVHSVYGGVRFSLDKFNLQTSAAGQRVSAASLQSFRVPHAAKAGSSLLATQSLRPAPIGMSAAQLPPESKFAPPLSVGGMKPAQLKSAFARTPAALSAQSVPGPFSSSPLRAPPPVSRKLQGVDLRLDSFDLSSLSRLSTEACSGAWNGAMKPLGECVAMGGAFWTCLNDDSNKLFKDDDRALLRDIFHPTLSDRQREGDLFVPPSTNFSYVAKLRTLLKDEHLVRQSRMQHFFSTSFVPSKPGNLFPWSWAASSEVAGGSTSASRGSRAWDSLQPRPDLLGQAAIASMIPKLVPVFDRCAEDGARYRIYRQNALELRTTQKLNGQEVVGAVFSICGADSSDTKVLSKKVQLQMNEKLAKVTEYVERSARESMSSSGLHCTYFLLLQTDRGNTIMTERGLSGDLTWDVNPENLERRISLAKVTRSKECKTGVTVQDMREIRIRLAGIASREGRKLSSKRYTSFAFKRAAGSMLVMLGSQPPSSVASKCR